MHVQAYWDIVNLKPNDQFKRLFKIRFITSRRCLHVNGAVRSIHGRRVVVTVGVCRQPPDKKPGGASVPRSAGGFSRPRSPRRGPHTTYFRRVCSFGRRDQTLARHRASLRLAYTHSGHLRGSNLPQVQEGRRELVADEAACVGVAELLVSC